MTISTTESHIDYLGNGVTVVFAIPFRFLANGDIKVELVDTLGLSTPLTEGTDYTLTGADADAGGMLTMNVAPPNGFMLSIYRDVPMTQETDYISGDSFPAESHERALDKLTMIAQQLVGTNNRSISVPESNLPASAVTLPQASVRANRFIAFDASGNAIVADTLGSGVPVTPFMETLLDDVGASNARVTLDAAARGANSDITSLSGLTTPLSVAQGGTGQNGLAALAASLYPYNPPTIQPVIVSVNGVGGAPVNGMRITLNPTVLDFRSTTLGDGSVTRVIVPSAITLTVSNGSSLGTSSGVASKLAVLAINNAGTVELAVVNVAGGVNLNESGLISTTAEGGAGAADSATTVYSTTACTNVAYRLLGFIESTQATAGTWATAPSLVLGSSGPLALWLSGYGQKWQPVTRTSGTPYTNDTGRTITIGVQRTNTLGGVSTTIDGVVVLNSVLATGAVNNMTETAPIGPGESYTVTAVSSATYTVVERR